MKAKTKREQENASKFIVSMVKKYPNQVKIISISISTNIGLALKNNKKIIFNKRNNYNVLWLSYKKVIKKMIK